MQSPKSERRDAPRIEVRTNALLVCQGDTVQRCRILDINEYGCRLHFAGFEPVDQFHLVNPQMAVVYSARVMWRQPPLAGTRFLGAWTLASSDCPAWLRDAVTRYQASRLAQTSTLRVA